ncbi:hypothetical protein QQG09_02830 [Melissococcus plutonius]|uniref:EamA domain-containing protein n=1 Tax=Melissococcus plutonius TaxID=33970 RepID=A0A2Z5Y311_9ENTE|nr:hypothetical protein [Melissococcus plutonius]BAL62351.1 hypothetical protein MPD5_1129 [Melissococcus plutonius DAT561]MCV2498119.1 hypothetical protein [Melissococcus plutonius]MCV2500706.1 hypothetical protein [Melissococcus plutonius]MCV2504329.1 hypothetical protein [Melissococcus plutonius]MCV2506734.1 hypothetical protein [Melissococcus plutonius]
MFLFIIYVFLSSAGLVLFKLGSGNLSLHLQHSYFSMNISLLAVAGLLCYLVSFVLWMLIISRSEISYIVPLGVACTNITILLASYFILQEVITTHVLIGAIIIIIGIVIMNLK